MKTTLLLFIIFSQVCFSQYDWTRVNQPCGGMIRTTEFSNDSIYAGGYGGVFVSSKRSINWRYIGLGGENGISDILVIDECIFVTTWSGIFKSCDFGFSWTKVYNGQVNSLALIDTIIIAGSENSGVIRSNNYGISWNSANVGVDNFSIRLVYEADGVLLASAAGASGSGMFRSVDSANSWIRLDPYPYSWNAEGITKNNGILYSFDFNNSAKVYKSTDLGLTWFLPSGATNPADIIQSIYSIDNEIYVGIYRFGLFKSTNEGITWMQINNGIINKDILSVNGSDSLILSSAFSGVNITFNKGTSWNNLSQGLNNSSITTLLSVDNNLFAGTYGAGIFRSNDNGNSWTKLNHPNLYVGDLLSAHNRIYTIISEYYGGPYPAKVYWSLNLGENWSSSTFVESFRCLTASGENLLVGSGYGLYRSTNYGQTWTNIVNGIPNHIVVTSIASKDSIILFTNGGGGIYRSSDYGLSWNFITISGLYSAHKIKFAGDRFYVGSSQVNVLFESMDNGLTWSSVQTPLFNADVLTLYGYDNYKFVGLSNNNGVLISTNYGINWQVSNPFTANKILSFEKHNLTLYAGTDGAGIYRLNDIELPVELVSFDAEISENDVLLTWSTISEKNNQGFEIYRKDSKNDFVLLGFVNGNGTSTEKNYYVFRDKNILNANYTYRLKQIDYNGTSTYSNEINIGVNTALKYDLLQNFPNPFNPTTLIKFSIPKSEFVQIKIYDILGTEIKTLVNEFIESGYHEFEFEAIDLPSGVYLYRITSGNYSETKKMLLLK